MTEDCCRVTERVEEEVQRGLGDAAASTTGNDAGILWNGELVGVKTRDQFLVAYWKLLCNNFVIVMLVFFFPSEFEFPFNFNLLFVL